MSMALCIDSVRSRTKRVTRRREDRWVDTSAGDQLTFVEKAMGLRRGERQVVIDHGLVVDVRVEPLALVDATEVALEGFAGTDPTMWRIWWAISNGYRIPNGMTDLEAIAAWAGALECRRIEFVYLDQAPCAETGLA